MARAASRALFRGLLNRDIRTTQDDIMEQARELEKQQKRMGQFGSIGSLLGSIAAGALVPMTGGASLAAAPIAASLIPLLTKGATSAIGSALGEKVAGRMYDVDIKASDTGLLGSQFDTLQDLETDADKGILGRSLGRGASTMLLSGAEKYLKGLLNQPGSEALGANALEGLDNSFGFDLPAIDTSVGGEFGKLPKFDPFKYGSNGFITSKFKFQNGGLVPYNQSSTVKQDVSDLGGYYGGKSLQSIPAQLVGGGSGERFYLGEGESQDMQLALTKALLNARVIMADSPQDSIPRELLESLFKQGQEQEPIKRRGLLSRFR